jgi:hypothetical protein
MIEALTQRVEMPLWLVLALAAYRKEAVTRLLGRVKGLNRSKSGTEQ